MKTTRIILIVLVMMASVGSWAVNYPTYKPSYSTSQVAPVVNSGMIKTVKTSHPSYRSTRSQQPVEPYQGEAYSGITTSRPTLTPMLNADGLAENPYGEDEEEAGMARGPRRVKDDDAMPEGPAGNSVPVGATPWLMMLLLLGGYAVYQKYVNNKQSIL